MSNEYFGRRNRKATGPIRPKKKPEQHSGSRETEDDEAASAPAFSVIILRILLGVVCVAVPGICVSIVLKSEIGDSPAAVPARAAVVPAGFDPASFPNTAHFLEKSEEYGEFQAAYLTGNPVRLKADRSEFIKAVAHLNGKEVRWSGIVTKIDESSIYVGIHRPGVFCAPVEISVEKSPLLMQRLPQLAMRQTVNISARIESITPYASKDDFREMTRKSIEADMRSKFERPIFVFGSGDGIGEHESANITEQM